MFQLDGTKDIKSIALNQESTSSSLSPQSVYHFKTDRSILDLDKSCEGVCRENVTLSWFWPDDCQAKFVCNEMKGSPCSNYGVQLSYPEEEIQDVCFARNQYEGSLGFNQEMTLSLWYSPHLNDTIDLSCFLWCTEDGDLPPDMVTETISEELLVSIVRKATLPSKFLPTISHFSAQWF